MEPNPEDELPSLTVLESVRCLECDAVYAKPSGGDTMLKNPGCPECGYVGWMADVARPFSEVSRPRHSGADRLPHRSG